MLNVVAGKHLKIGKYSKMKTMHRGKPYYATLDGSWCIFFARHWKVDSCDFITSGQGWSQGYGWSKINVQCPGDIGSNWRYYSWSGGSDSGPVDKSIGINCLKDGKNNFLSHSPAICVSSWTVWNQKQCSEN